jgi:UDP:flavonoid glycosyltransferase YjiC (YdhE family)
MHLSIVAIGSRRDVQPYLALGLGLKSAGYQVQFCADQIFEGLVTATGLNFTPVTAAPVNLMQQNLSRVGGPLKLICWFNQHFKPLARDFFRSRKSYQANPRHPLFHPGVCWLPCGRKTGRTSLSSL